MRLQKYSGPEEGTLAYLSSGVRTNFNNKHITRPSGAVREMLSSFLFLISIGWILIRSPTLVLIVYNTAHVVYNMSNSTERIKQLGI